jgi:TonB family protein
MRHCFIAALVLAAACSACSYSEYRVSASSPRLPRAEAEAEIRQVIRRNSARNVPELYDSPIEALSVGLPEYPHEGINGDVVVEFTIEKDGGVVDVVVIKSPHASLTRAAIDAVSRWRFQPILKGGKPIPVRITWPMSFGVG